MAFENKKYLFVVEGNTDEDRLKKLGVTYIIKTGGKFIREDILLFLKEVHERRNVILLTDPDGPGRKIASYIEGIIGECIILKADKKKAIYHEKVGIAEMKLDDIHNLINDYLLHDKDIKEEVLTNDDMIDLGLIGPNGKKRRMVLIEKYHMPFTSGKNVLDALNMLSLSVEDIRKELEDE
jgi:ribonuclease M5